MRIEYFNISSPKPSVLGFNLNDVRNRSRDKRPIPMEKGFSSNLGYRRLEREFALRSIRRRKTTTAIEVELM